MIFGYEVQACQNCQQFYHTENISNKILKSLSHLSQGQCPTGDATTCEMQCVPERLLILDNEKLKIVDGNSLYLKDGLCYFS